MTNQQPAAAQPTVAPTNALGTAAGVVGIVGMGLIWVPFLGGILCLISTALGGVALRNGKRDSLPNGMAITGLVLGIVGLAIYLLVTIGLFASNA